MTDQRKDHVFLWERLGNLLKAPFPKKFETQTAFPEIFAQAALLAIFRARQSLALFAGSTLFSQKAPDYQISLGLTEFNLDVTSLVEVDQVISMKLEVPKISVSEASRNHGYSLENFDNMVNSVCEKAKDQLKQVELQVKQKTRNAQQSKTRLKKMYTDLQRHAKNKETDKVKNSLNQIMDTLTWYNTVSLANLHSWISRLSKTIDAMLGLTNSEDYQNMLSDLQSELAQAKDKSVTRVRLGYKKFKFSSIAHSEEMLTSGEFAVKLDLATIAEHVIASVEQAEKVKKEVQKQLRKDRAAIKRERIELEAQKN